MISMSQPQSLLAKRTFWPRRPIANDNWSSRTNTIALPNIWQRITSSTSAGCEAFGDEDLQVFAPTDNVDPLATQFVDDILDAIAADAHARPHAIHPLVRAAHRHLGAVTGLAGHRPHLDHPVGDFGDLLFERSLHQVRPRAAEDDPHAGALLADLGDRRPHPFVGVVRLSGNLLALGRIASALGSEIVAAPPSYFCTTPVTNWSFISVYSSNSAVALGLADLLDHDLLRGLSGHPLRDLRWCSSARRSARP